jgi:hypothetical protein
MGLFSFYRYEMVSLLLQTRTLIPDFSFSSFSNIWQNTFYEYYRPGEYVIWGITYLIAGDTPYLYQIFVSIIYGLIAVGLYLAARFFAGEFAGWIAALTYAYLEAAVVLSWWSANIDGFFGMLCLIAGLVLFLYMPFRSSISVILSTVCIGLAVFTKETHILLWIIFPLFILTAPNLKSRTHYTIAAATLIICILKLFLQSLTGATPGDHIVDSLFDIDPLLASQNYIDYGRLLLYGHNVLLIGLCIIRPDGDTSFKRMTGLLVALLLLFIIARMAGTMWLLDLTILVILPYHFFKARYFERIWIIWTLVGLSLVILYDTRIVGSIMNRRVLEPSMGFALFVGCSLAYYPAYIKQHLNKRSLQNIKKDLFHIRRLPHLVWRHMDIICLALILLFGFRQEVSTSGIMKEWRYWIAEGEVLRTIIHTLNETLPPESVLMADAVPGLQKSEQINDALVFMFNRGDVKMYNLQDHISDNKIRFSNGSNPFFALTTEPLGIETISASSPALLDTFMDRDQLVKVLYLYRLQGNP